ncbi:TIM-barrel domain-containing protein [Saccharicrinis sp. 156]|uniref:glycoside hydrolase family 31 protein n=1 Tax=Saccharicrinis sp. 156 TaxID=3417574 RepID=UPI003D33C130
MLYHFNNEARYNADACPDLHVGILMNRAKKRGELSTKLIKQSVLQKITWGFVLLSILVLSGCQCPHEGRHVENVELTPYGLLVETNESDILLKPLSEHSIEVEYLIEGHKNPASYALIDYDEGNINTNFEEDRKQVMFSTEGITIKIQKCPLKLSYFQKDKLLFSEEKGLVFNDSIKGFRIKLQPGEKLMGGGERVLGMNRRGNRLRLYNQASYGYGTHAELMYYSLPIVISSNKYMLLFDNTADGYLDLGKTEESILQFETVGGRMSYVLTASDDWQELTENYTEVTGRQPMPPRWALGNISSRMGYRNQKQVEQVVEEYLKQDFPLDGIVLDLYWFGPDLKGHMGNLEWDKKAFPEPEKMLKKIKDKGVKTVLITEPFILKESGKYQECAEQNLLGTDSLGQPYIYDFYFGTTALLDIFKPETKKWFWHIYKKHTVSGVDGWWGDLGEPEVHPDSLLHVNGPANEVHNAYGHEWAKTVYDGFSKDFPDRRPVILMRAGYAGSQRYGMIPWSGDVSRSWEGLQPQVEVSLQMGMQGLAYMHSDLGGFAGDYEDAELYTRWLQYGVFQPVYRTHAQEDVPPEPIFWDKQTKNITRRYIKLRYALTPYLYTMAYQNSTQGTPLMRPLFYLGDNTDRIEEKNSYLWGENFLVAPVTQKGVTEWNVNFPSGSNWYNFFTGKKYEGGKRKTVPVNIKDIPVFVKGGSFIPMVPEFKNMEEYHTDKLILHYYYDSSLMQSAGFMYEDDGKTNNSWKNHQFEKLHFKSENTKGGVAVTITREAYDYKEKPESRDISLVVHNVEAEPKSLLVNNQIKNFSWDAEIKELIADFNMVSDKVEIEIK